MVGLSSLYVLIFTDLLAPDMDVLNAGNIRCAVQCTRADCAAFFYDQSSSRCYLSNTTFKADDPSLLSKSGVRFYIRNFVGYRGYQYDAVEDLSYKEYTVGATWILANQTCNNQGTRLPKILTKQRNNFYKAKRATMGTIWLGGSDLQAEGVYVWTDGTRIGGYTDWIWSNPDGGTSQNCMEMDQLSGVTGWFNGACNNHKRFVCEIAPFNEH